MKKMIFSVIWVLLGGILIALSFAGMVDEFWNGMGFGLVTIGALQLLRFKRLQTNEAYREAMEIAQTDERNHFIRGKAWAWSGYLFIIISAVLSIIFRIIGQELLSLAASYAVCMVLVLFWIFYWVLQKKY